MSTVSFVRYDNCVKTYQKHKTFAQDYYLAVHALQELEVLVPKVVPRRLHDGAVSRLVRPNAFSTCVLVQETPKASVVTAC